MRIGTDIVECSRIQEAIDRHPESFPSMVFTAEEIGNAPGNSSARTAYFAGRWAAKEAIAKALGCGFGEKCAWLEINIVNLPGGEPVAKLSGQALKTFGELGAKALRISISHERNYATAVALIE